ncbi:MAG: DNA adenine methylase [Ignavibacteria bacterium]|nr:DNA adenine methylase [Ignavibacteria bacterium]
MGYRYIGSKEKLSDIIISEIKTIYPEATKIIDLMAGTGLFSKALRLNGYCVTAVDVMTYSYHHLIVNLILQQSPEFENITAMISLPKQKSVDLFDSSRYELVIKYLNNLAPINGYFFREFSPEGIPLNGTPSRKYFTVENAAKIDAIRYEIRSLYNAGSINDNEHSLLIHDLMMAANDVANIAGTYGHFLSKFVDRAKVPIQLTPSQFVADYNNYPHRVMLGYAEELAPSLEGDLCYIDPPYIKRQYAANYHILETIAREDEPEAIGVSGLRPWRDQYSFFCSKLHIRKSFERILNAIKCDNFLISYSEDGLLPIEDLMTFLSKFGTVSKKEIKYKRFKSNNSSKDSTLHEYLINLRKL